MDPVGQKMAVSSHQKMGKIGVAAPGTTDAVRAAEDQFKSSGDSSKSVDMAKKMLFVFPPISDQQPKAYECHAQRQSEPCIVTVVIEKGSRPRRPMTEVEEVICRKKGPSSETDDVNNTPEKGLHHRFSLQKNPFSPKRTGAKD